MNYTRIEKACRHVAANILKNFPGTGNLIVSSGWHWKAKTGMRTSRILILLLALAPVGAFGADPAAAHPRLLTPDVYATTGSNLTLTLLLPVDANPGAPPRAPLQTLTLIWVANDRTEESVFTLQPGPSSPLTLNGQNFLTFAYTGIVPGGLNGPAMIETREMPIARGLVSVQTKRSSLLLAESAATPARPPSAEKRTPAAGIQTAAPLDAEDHELLLRRAIRTPIIPGLSADEPVYLVLGYRPGLNARFQLSFKYKPFETTWLRHFGGAFTTTSLWDLHSASLPFVDTTYRPSLSWYGDPKPFLGSKNVRLTWQVGMWEHESNGKGDTDIGETEAGSDSRSLNIGFIRPKLTWDVTEKDSITVGLKVYGYYSKTVENGDINLYRGYADLQLRYQHDDWIFSGVFRRGSVGYFCELNFGIPQNSFIKWFSPDLGKKNVHGWLMLQYLTGYGETLLAYNRRIPEQLRAGFMLVP
jgi:outer membrane phospholipase A